jgi:hypothetical protein
MKIAEQMIRVNPKAEAYTRNSKSGITSRRIRHWRSIRSPTLEYEVPGTSPPLIHQMGGPIGCSLDAITASVPRL